MAVVGDEVMVCECNNGGTILVYDREVKYVRRIEQDGMEHYVSVFARHEDFAVSFDQGGDKETSNPHGACVDDTCM